MIRRHPLRGLRRAVASLVLLTLTLGCQPPAAEAPSTSTAAAVIPADSTGPALTPADADAILADVRAGAAKATVMNVWATWCAPCRQEFPDLVELYRTHRDAGLRLVLVSADFDDQVDEARAFLAQQGVDFGSFLKTGDDMKFIDSLNPRWSGALPATFVYDANGQLRDFWEGMASYEEMQRRVLPVLASTGTPE